MASLAQNPPAMQVLAQQIAVAPAQVNFFNLPRAVRDRIYSLTVVVWKNCRRVLYPEDPCGFISSTNLRHLNFTFPAAPVAAMMSLNRQINNEYSAKVFGSFKVAIVDGPWMPDANKQILLETGLLTKLTMALDKVKHVELIVDCSNCVHVPRQYPSSKHLSYLMDETLKKAHPNIQSIRVLRFHTIKVEDNVTAEVLRQLAGYPYLPFTPVLSGDLSGLPMQQQLTVLSKMQLPCITWTYQVDDVSKNFSAACNISDVHSATSNEDQPAKSETTKNDLPLDHFVRTVSMSLFARHDNPDLQTLAYDKATWKESFGPIVDLYPVCCGEKTNDKVVIDLELWV